MTRIQFGWVLPLPGNSQDSMPPETFNAELHRGLDLITGQFDSAWYIDHLQGLGKQPLLEGWTTITYLAALYPQLIFGNSVLSQSFRNPALLAKMAATFQYISGGRLIFGIGAGNNEEELKAYGYKFSPAGTRVEELEETLKLVKALWDNECITLYGKHYRVVNAYCNPKPNPLPPIMIGGAKPRLLRLIARHADWWNADRAKIANYRMQVTECERACIEVNRDPADLRRTWFGGCICAPTEAAIKSLNTANKNQDYGFIGTPTQILEQIQPFIDLGVDYFILETSGFPDLTTLESLITEVIPALNR